MAWVLQSASEQIANYDETKAYFSAADLEMWLRRSGSILFAVSDVVHDTSLPPPHRFLSSSLRESKHLIAEVLKPVFDAQLLRIGLNFEEDFAPTSYEKKDQMSAWYSTISEPSTFRAADIAMGSGLKLLAAKLDGWWLAYLDNAVHTWEEMVEEVVDQKVKEHLNMITRGDVEYAGVPQDEQSGAEIELSICTKLEELLFTDIGAILEEKYFKFWCDHLVAACLFTPKSRWYCDPALDTNRQVGDEGPACDRVAKLRRERASKRSQHRHHDRGQVVVARPGDRR